MRKHSQKLISLDNLLNSNGLKYTTYLHIKEHVTNTMRRPIIFRRCKIIRWSAGFNKLMQQLPSYIAFVYWYLWHSLKIHLHLAQKIRKGHYGTTIDTLLLFTELLLRIVVVADTDVYWVSQSNDALIGWLFIFFRILPRPSLRLYSLRSSYWPGQASKS